MGRCCQPENNHPLWQQIRDMYSQQIAERFPDVKGIDDDDITVIVESGRDKAPWIEWEEGEEETITVDDLGDVVNGACDAMFESDEFKEWLADVKLLADVWGQCTPSFTEEDMRPVKMSDAIPTKETTGRKGGPNCCPRCGTPWEDDFCYCCGNSM